jgi:hypothetical protein
MAKNMDVIVAETLGRMHLQIAALQVQVEELSEQLEAAKKANEPKSARRDEPPLHEVRK